jgi:hypothetical protein
MSSSSPLPCITLPAPKNRQALKNAWVMTCRKAAQKAPTPRPRNIRPSCETVEYASTFLMPVWLKAINAASSAVAPPMSATVIITWGESTSR